MSLVSRQLRRLRRHGLCVAASLGGLWVVQHAFSAGLLKAANEVGGNFLQTFGGMYGVIMAFAIYVVWQQLNETQVAIEREAVSLGEVHHMIGFFSGWSNAETVRIRLREYALAVPANNSLPRGKLVDEAALLDACLRDLLAWKPGATEDERLWPVVMDLFHEVSEARERRVTSARLRMGEGLRGFVVIGGVFTVATLWMMSMESLVMHCIFTALLTWVVVAAASIVFDLDDPYTGDFVVNWRRFRELAERMGR